MLHNAIKLREFIMHISWHKIELKGIELF